MVKEVCIIGLGYIGLPTAAMFAMNGVRVHGVDIQQSVCNTINEGKIHIVEPGLDSIVKNAVEDGVIKASTIVEPCDNFIISVPTPITPEKSADLSYVVSAASSIVRVLRPGNLVILESTVSPRCTLDVLIPELEKSGLKAGDDFMVAHCPERVLPGQILHELVFNNRIIGGINDASISAAKELYDVFVKGEMILTDATTAEMCKLMENTYRDVNIALANELAAMCEKLGIDAWEVIRYANKHPRVNLHQPGPGVGGHCIAVDPWFVVEAAPEIAKMISLARRTNDNGPYRVLERIKSIVPPGSHVVLLGCTYKPNVDDIRESPIIELFELAQHAGYNVCIVDPLIKSYNTDIYDALSGADLAVLTVHHDVFSGLDLPKVFSVMRTPNLYDTRNFISRGAVVAAGIHYFLLGSGK